MQITLYFFKIAHKIYFHRYNYKTIAKRHEADCDESFEIASHIHNKFFCNPSVGKVQ